MTKSHRDRTRGITWHLLRGCIYNNRFHWQAFRLLSKTEHAPLRPVVRVYRPTASNSPQTRNATSKPTSRMHTSSSGRAHRTLPFRYNRTAYAKKESYCEKGPGTGGTQTLTLTLPQLTSQFYTLSSMYAYMKKKLRRLVLHSGAMQAAGVG